MTERYLSLETFQAWGHSETSYDTDLIIAAIDAATDWLDMACGRRFAVAGAGSARTYVPTFGSGRLMIDDCTTVTALTENGTALAENTDYVLRPLNNLAASGETVPYDVALRLDKPWYTNGHRATISVTATWGWAAIPTMIVEACKILTKEFLEQRDVRHGLVGFSEAGGIRATDNLKVRQAVERYSKLGYRAGVA